MRHKYRGFYSVFIWRNPKVQIPISSSGDCIRKSTVGSAFASCCRLYIYIYRRLSHRKAQDEFTRREKTATDDLSRNYAKCNGCTLGGSPYLKICQLTAALSDLTPWHIDNKTQNASDIIRLIEVYCSKFDFLKFDDFSFLTCSIKHTGAQKNRPICPTTIFTILDYL